MTRPSDVAQLAARAVDVSTYLHPLDAAREAAQAGLSRVDVVVERNDTLDRIFRRLQLSLTDLANLRAVEGVRTALDRLRPGDQLTLVHRGEELMGLERSLSSARH